MKTYRRAFQANILFQGIAFAEYVEPANANEPALNTLNGMDVGGKKLKIVKACVGGTQVANFDAGINAISNLASQGSGGDTTRVLQLLNMVTAEELMDNDDYEGTDAQHNPL